jgi:hypothetical protein
MIKVKINEDNEDWLDSKKGGKSKKSSKVEDFRNAVVVRNVLARVTQEADRSTHPTSIDDERTP